MSKSAYQFYPSLLDSFQNYLDSEKNWEEFYGGSEEPSISLDDYNKQAEQELIDRINRVPFESEAADRGTAFNEVIDCLILGRQSEREGMAIRSCKKEDKIIAEYKGAEYHFSLPLCTTLAKVYAGSIPQYKCCGVIDTKYGNVTLYGFLDELLPTRIVDLKTTTNYSAFKFRNHWQHIVYPYCLSCEGVEVYDFDYDVIKFSSKKITETAYTYYKEHYSFDKTRDAARLRLHIESFIEFINAHKEQITDKKITNSLEGEDEILKSNGI